MKQLKRLVCAVPFRPLLTQREFSVELECLGFYIAKQQHVESEDVEPHERALFTSHFSLRDLLLLLERWRRRKRPLAASVWLIASST